MGRNILEQQHTSDGHVDNIVGHINDLINEKEEKKESLSGSEKENFEKIQKTFLNFNATIEELDFVVKEYLDSQGKPGEKKKLLAKKKLDSFKEQFKWWDIGNNPAANKAAR